MRVTHFHRRPAAGQHSIEQVFADIRAAMPARYQCVQSECRFRSTGIIPRIYNTIEAAARQSDVNHVTGDVHYVTYFLRRERTLLTVLDCVTLHRLRGLRRRLFHLLWYRVPTRRAALVSVISHSTKRELLGHVPIDPTAVRVVPCCVSPCFRPAPRMPGKRPVILQIGTAENKNLPRLAEALNGLNCELRIIGRPTSEQERALVANGVRYRHVHGLQQRDVVSAYEDCDLVAFVSTYEGFGLPILEGNAVGRPVVTSNVYSMPEVADTAACLVNPLDPQAIRRGIDQVLGNPAYRTQLIEAGYANAQRFSPGQIAGLYGSIYEELASA